MSTFWRTLHPVERIALTALLLWLGAGLLFTVLRVTPEEIALAPFPVALILLQSFIIACLRWGDPLLIFLAFITTHLTAARRWTPLLARRWALQIFCASWLIETIGTLTSYPFGAYTYTTQFGPRLGVIPFTIPLAWILILTNTLFLIRDYWPHLSRTQEALSVGALATAYDFILEPFATEVKHYWIWTSGSIPWQNYAAWFGLSAVLVYFLAPTASGRARWDVRPALVLGGTLLIFMAGRLLG